MMLFDAVVCLSARQQLCLLLSASAASMSPRNNDFILLICFGNYVLFTTCGFLTGKATNALKVKTLLI